MKISAAGIKLIKQFEGFRAVPYRDSVGILTVGWGSTGPHIHEGMILSREEAEALLRDDLARFEAGVEELVKVPLTPGQFDALVSFCFNLGLDSLKQSTLLKKLNAHDYAGAADCFPAWVFAGGKRQPGLVTRRAAERKLFLSGITQEHEKT